MVLYQTRTHDFLETLDNSLVLHLIVILASQLIHIYVLDNLLV